MRLSNTFAAFVRAAETGSSSAPADTAKPETPALGADAAKQLPRSNVAAKPRVTAKHIAAKRNAKPAAKAAKPAKPGKPADPPAIDGRAVRIAAERADATAFFRAFGNAASVPVKPLSAFKPVASSRHPNERGVSVRQCAAIAAAFAGAGAKLADGKSAPRVFEHNGIRHCIENGVMRDAISSGLITVSGTSPETEKLTLARNAATRIVGMLGERVIKAAKLA